MLAKIYYFSVNCSKKCFIFSYLDKCTTLVRQNKAPMQHCTGAFRILYHDGITSPSFPQLTL